MNTQLKQIQARLVQTAAKDGIKIKKMKYKSALYFSEDSAFLSFEAASFDFDLLDHTLLLFPTVDPKYVMTRSIGTPGKKELLVAMNKALSGAPLKKLDMIAKTFTKDFAKSYQQYISDLQQAINTVQDMD